MSKFFRDNALALSLGGCCLALSAWLYLTEAPSSNPAVAAAPQATEPARRPQAVAAQDTARAAKKDGAAPAVNASSDAAAPQLDGLHLSPADWQSSSH